MRSRARLPHSGAGNGAGMTALFFAAGFDEHRRERIRVRAPIVSILDKCRSLKFS
jgi:hypothetical protein